jgi:hypothetical protein
MDLGYRNILAPGPNYPPDFRSTLPRPLQRSSESCEMEKTPRVTGKRRGGSRKACNECKQQKVSHMRFPDYHSMLSPVSDCFSSTPLMPDSCDVILFKPPLRLARAVAGWG